MANEEPNRAWKGVFMTIHTRLSRRSRLLLCMGSTRKGLPPHFSNQYESPTRTEINVSALNDQPLTSSLTLVFSKASKHSFVVFYSPGPPPPLIDRIDVTLCCADLNLDSLYIPTIITFVNTDDFYASNQLHQLHISIIAIQITTRLASSL